MLLVYMLRNLWNRYLNFSFRKGISLVRINPTAESTIDPVKKYINANTDLIKLQSVKGWNPFSVRFLINQLNRKGCRVCEISNTQNRPVTDINAIDRSAGCFASTSTPSPTSVAATDK